MEWRDEGIVLGDRAIGESASLVEAMTRSHGRHLGLVHGGQSRRQRALLQAGNRLDLIWRSRLDEQLGSFVVEPISLDAARLMEHPVAAFGLQTAAALLRHLPERDPHPALYEATCELLSKLDGSLVSGAQLARFELMLLDEFGFGLDLSECAATGRSDDLAYVSPRSGRAVSRQAGEPYRDRLFQLPAFLIGGQAEALSLADVEAALELTGHFLERNLLSPEGQTLPAARASFRRALRRAINPGQETPAG